MAAMLLLLLGNQVHTLVPYSGIMFLPRCMNLCLLPQNYNKGETEGYVPISLYILIYKESRPRNVERVSFFLKSITKLLIF
jgi:hypothetical protein